MTYPLLGYHEVLLRGPSPPSVADRELIAPYGADAEEVLAAGFQEQALHDAIAVCGLFNLMNRLVTVG
jgi:hypothetical protein